MPPNANFATRRGSVSDQTRSAYAISIHPSYNPLKACVFLLIAKDLSLYKSNPWYYMSNDVSVNALCSIHRAVGHLHRPGTNAPLDHPLSHLIQSRAGQDLAPIRAVDVFSSTPQDLRSRACSRPDHGVQVDRVRLLCPDMDFTTQDERALVGRDTLEGIIGVHETPVLGRTAVVRIRPCRLGCWTLGEVKPLAFSAVEVLYER